MATKIICRATDCIFWEDKMCTSEEIIYDPEEGCLTYEVLDEVDLGEDEDEWEDDELIEADEDEDEELAWDDDEEEDLFLDDDMEGDDDDDRDWRL